MIPLAIAPELVEEAVLLAERQVERSASTAFRRERERAYATTGAETRERIFGSTALRWFDRFGLRKRLEEAIAACPGVEGLVCEARIVRARARSEEAADLLDPADSHRADRRPTLLLRLRAESLLDRAALEALIAHELFHVADMLDPAFGYQRALPSSDGGPSAENLLRDRYRVLWDVTIDGRLTAARRSSPGVRVARAREFTSTFAMLGGEGSRNFERWWNEPRPTHRSLLAYAAAPLPQDTAATARRCPVCRFPVMALDPRAAALPSRVVAAVRARHPAWHPQQGLCAQCVDLYEARAEPPLASHTPAPQGW